MTIQQNFVNIKPSLNLDFANTKQLDPRITFARASTARFYDGKTTALAEQNLWTFSQEFDNAIWGKSAITVTANATTAPDGTTTADLLIPSTANSGHTIFRSFVAGLQTVSLFAKAAGYNFITLADGSSGQLGKLTIDLSNGTITQNTAAEFLTVNITNVGNGWYRIAISRNFSVAVSFTFGATNSSTGGDLYGPIAFAGDGTSGIYLWGAQLELRSFATAYTPTTTAPITNYIPVLQTAAAGTPRFDHNPVTGESLGLLIEEQRSNLLTYSEDFSNAAWGKSQVGAGSIPVVTANTAIAPDGSTTADTVVFVSPASGDQSVLSRVSATSPGAYTGSFYVRATSAGDVGKIIAFRHVGTAAYTLITLTSSWQRAASTEVRGGEGFDINLRPSVGTSSGTVSVQLWGAQLEAGAFPTSYIPTVQSQVTRAADSASITGSNFSSWYRQDEGTIYFGLLLNSNQTNDQTIVQISNGVTSNDSIFVYAQRQSARFRGDVYVANTAQAIFTYTAAGTPTAGVLYKAALGYKINDFNMAINNNAASTDTLGIVPVVDRMFIGIAGSGGVSLNGTISRIAYYPIRISDTQLQALTS
jgi:hypothetical protein